MPLGLPGDDPLQHIGQIGLRIEFVKQTFGGLYVRPLRHRLAACRRGPSWGAGPEAQ
jgi:hypothetical protein